MQPDERVGLQPVPADAVPPVDEDHADVGMVDQRVGERHARSTCTHHQVVGVEGARHAPTVAPRWAPRPRGAAVGEHDCLTAGCAHMALSIDLTGRTALVTGSTQGIGLAIARASPRRGRGWSSTAGARSAWTPPSTGWAARRTGGGRRDHRRRSGDAGRAGADGRHTGQQPRHLRRAAGPLEISDDDWRAVLRGQRASARPG